MRLICSVEGLVQIDSSSGPRNKFWRQRRGRTLHKRHFEACVLRGPGMDYAMRKKSRIMRCARIGAKLTKCTVDCELF